MKLYASLTSERGKPVSKSGNDYIHIDVHNEQREIMLTIRIESGVLGVIHKPVYQMSIRNWVTGKEIKTTVNASR